ncbi:MAG: hypothetical protein ABIT71_00915 [Vicinamibacteraceae bacterium]
MNRTSRLFLMGSGFVLAAGLGTGLVAFYGGLPTLASAARSVGPDELKYVPEAAAVVAYANVRDVMNSEFRQKIKSVLPDGEAKGQEEFQRETGINIEQDIDYVLAWMTPGPNTEGKGHPIGLVLAHGRFDTAKLEALAISHGGLVETIGSVRVIRPEANHRPDVEVEAPQTLDATPTVREHLRRHPAGAAPMVAFLEPGLIAIGEEATIRAAIAHGSSGGRSIRDNADMANLIGDLEGSSNVWAVGRMEALTKNAQLPEPLAQHLPAVKWFSASSHVGAGVSGLLRAEARDEDSAKNLRDVLQGFMAMAKLHAGQKPELAPVLQSLTVSGTGTTVALSFEVPPALVDALIELKNAAN